MTLSFQTVTLWLAAAVVLFSVSFLLKPRDGWLLLRIFIYLSVLFILLGPSISMRRTRTRDARLGVYVDRSRSMGVEERYMEAYKEVNRMKEAFGSAADLSIYGFDSEVWSMQKEELKTEPEGDRTDISAVFDEGVYDARVLISDGRDNWGESPLAHDRVKMTPVFTLGTGSRSPAPDLEISGLKVPGFAFRGREVEIGFKLLNKASDTGRTTALVRNDEKIVSRKPIELGGREKIPVSMSFVPEDTGLHSYTLEVEEIPGEVNLANNVRNFQIQVNRKKIRIIYVAGKPSWEYSFLRRLIKSDPHIDLVTFLILRNPENVTIVPENELSLIHFPAREMFTEKIYDFDLLIYDNFAYGNFFPENYLHHIKEFVAEGGGFIMTGGENSFLRGGYAKTPIGEILPVTFNENLSRWQVEEYKIEPAYSLSHPLLNIARDEDLSRQIWSEMPSLEGYDPGLEAKGSADVLMKKGGKTPIIAVKNYGEGRTMALNANTTWRWCMGLAGRGRGPHYYNRFWRETIRYMIRTGDVDRVQIFPARDRVNMGEYADINIRVLDEYLQPLDNALLEVRLKKPSGEKISVSTPELTDGDGWYETSVYAPDKGEYGIIVRASLHNRLIGENRESFRVSEADREMIRTSLNEGLLKEIASVSGGRYFSAGKMDYQKILERAKEKVPGEISRNITWSWWPFYIVLITALFTEWYLRRKRGLN